MEISIACIAVRGGRVLIAHRNPSGQMGGRWEFPGGKLEPGESTSAAIVREMSEEFGVTVEPLGKITESEFMHNGKRVSLQAFHVRFPHSGKRPDPEFSLTEHTGYVWVLPEEIPGLHFVDSDLQIYPAVKEYVKTLAQ